MLLYTDHQSVLPAAETAKSVLIVIFIQKTATGNAGKQSEKQYRIKKEVITVISSVSQKRNRIKIQVMILSMLLTIYLMIKDSRATLQ